MQHCADVGALRYCCEHNRNRCYVPEWLLGAWGTDVDATFSETPPHPKVAIAGREPGDQSIDKAAEPERECGFPRSGTVA